MSVRRGVRYTPEEIILLVNSNRGYGLERMIKKIYFENGTTRSQNQSRYFSDTLDVLMDYKETTGEDMYLWIQDPEMTTMVTRNTWKEITNNAPTPKGAGLSTSRTSKLDRKVGIGTNSRHIPLPPQEFDWGGVVPIWMR